MLNSVKFSNFKHFDVDNERVISHQNPINYWVGKALMNPIYTFVCKISNFQSVSTQKLSGKLRSKSQM